MARPPFPSNGSDEILGLPRGPGHLHVVQRIPTPDEPMPAVVPPPAAPAPPPPPATLADVAAAVVELRKVQGEHGVRLSKVERRIALAVAVGTGITTSAPHWLPQILERLF